jgi:hypothetical protein
MLASVTRVDSERGSTWIRPRLFLITCDCRNKSQRGLLRNNMVVCPTEPADGKKSAILRKRESIELAVFSEESNSHDNK